VYAQAKETSAMVSGNNNFGIDLLKQLDSSQSTGNVFISPVSVSQALGLLYIGSAGQTRKEIGDVLHVGDIKGADFDSGNQSLLSALKSPDDSVQISIANAIWSQTGKPFGNSYREEAADFFSAPAKTVDFTQPQSAAAAINSWVNSNTKGKIRELVSPDAVKDASMVLTNAVYFKGTWVDMFDSSLTQSAPFYLADGSTIQIPTMNRNATIASYFDQDVTVIELHYSGIPAASMVIVLPATGISINDIVKSLDTNTLDGWISQLIPRGVTLYLPKFHIDFTQDLTQSLQNLGIKTAFSRSADFTPTSIQDTSVTGVIHKATMDVDEQGTVAAAATGIIMKSLARPVPRVVRVDHPFFCAIRDDNTGELLFLGVVNHPDTLK
jgi:serpin B